MPKYIAFLRAINVGGHTVKMDQLKKLFKALAFANVETFIASGNVIFNSKGSAKSLERKIEAHLETSLGYKVATFLRTPTELTKVVEHNPFKDWKENGEGTLYIGFLSDIPAREAQKKLLAAATAVDEFHIQELALY